LRGFSFFEINFIESRRLSRVESSIVGDLTVKNAATKLLVGVRRKECSCRFAHV
jgi:hypothetical protein